MVDLIVEQRENFKRFMKKHNLKSYPWSLMAGVSEATIRAYINGRSESLTLKTLGKLAKAAGVEVSELFCNDNTAENTNHHLVDRKLIKRSIIKVVEIMQKKNIAIDPQRLSELVLAWYDLKTITDEKDLIIKGSFDKLIS